ncbi:MAG TPA: ABC transporter permease [Vicinamibacterales bacterium]
MFPLLAWIRSWSLGVHRSKMMDAEMAEEFQLHIELRAADLEREGMCATEAMRRARAEFGGTYNYAQQGREARGLAWFDWLRFSWLDFKLGGRMIAKYPGLTLMASVAIGVAIAVGAGVCGVITTIRSPTLPLDEGDRVVGIQMWDIAAGKSEYRISRDFAEWRSHLRSVSELGVFRPMVINLIGSDGRAEPLRGVEMSAVGFRVARVPPLLGRYLVDDDERPDAPPVAVIGYDVWRSKFGSDTGVVGRRVQFGGTLRTIVGVMPKGFLFPESYTAWIPLRLDPVSYEPGEGPALYVFGRLAKGATLDDARAELATLSAVAAHDHPVTHRNLRARIMPYAQSMSRNLDDASAAQAFRVMETIVVLLVVVICVNVATLVYARTATRQREIAVRSALGGTRGRIVAQLFGEACVLAGCGAAIGLALISIIASQIAAALARFGLAGIPFWIRFDVSRPTLGYIVGLTALGALIIGVLPALRLTGPRVQLSLQRLAGGHSTIRMGRLWTALIVTEVAFAVALLPAAVRFTGEWLRAVTTGPGFPAEQYLSAGLAMERLDIGAATGRIDPGKLVSRFARSRDALLTRLAAEPDVAGVTYADALPGSETVDLIEADSAPGADAATPPTHEFDKNPPRARFGRVDRRYFDMFDVPLVAGRTFGPTDTDSASNAVIVNHAFVDVVLHGHNAIGRRVRTLTYTKAGIERGPWHEVVGVVGDFPAELPFPDVPHAAVYRAANIGHLYPAALTIRLRTDPIAFADRLRDITATVQPDLLLRQVAPLNDRMHTQQLPLQWLAVSLAIVTLSVLMLSCAGVYALMSVVVTQRRREIGIRIALGAERRRVLWALFSRAAAQVGAGVAVGIVLAALVDRMLAAGYLLGEHRVAILAGVSFFMATFGMLAAWTPARNALRIPPTEALKAE